MIIADSASHDDNTLGGGLIPPCTGLAPDALPEVQEPVLAENSQTGVSTRNAQLSATLKIKKRRQVDLPRWYALRTTYGREKRAYDYLVSKKMVAFYPTITVVRLIGGKRKKVEESRIPNIFFAYGTEEQLKSYVYDNVNLPYLRFYYRYIFRGKQVVRQALVVPDDQIESLKIICANEAADIVLAPVNISKFQQGQMVRIIEGKFKGVVGKVARYQGQQRVAVIIDGLFTVATAYVPSAFLEKIETD